MIRRRIVSFGTAVMIAGAGAVVAASPASATPQASTTTAFLECQGYTLGGTATAFTQCSGASIGSYLNVTVHVTSPVSTTFLCTSLTVVGTNPATGVNALGVNCVPIGP